MTPAGDLASKLRGRKDGAQWRARCPAHNDSDPSLGIRDGVDGVVLVHCRAGCTQDAVLDTLRPVVSVREDPRTRALELHLIGGPVPNAGAAARLCAALAAAGRACQPAVFDGQKLALR